MVESAEPGWLHRVPVRVQFEDVDQYGIVHHPRYLLFMERARVDLMARLGLRPDGPGGPVGLVVVRVEVDYKKSARFYDALEIVQGCAEAGASRIRLAYSVQRGVDTLVTALLTLAFVDGTGRPIRAPGPIRDALRRMGTP